MAANIINDIKGARALLKRSLDIVTVVSDDMGPSPKPGPSDNWWCCPFHGEKTPSFSAHSTLQVYKCFGCHVGGDVITWTQNFHSISHTEALRHLASKYAIDISQFERPPTDEEVRRSRYLDINQAAAKFCCQQLFKNTTMLDWYKADSGFSIDQIADYDVGWCNSSETLVNHLFSIFPQLTQTDVDQLEFTNKLMWNNALVYPVRDASGHVVKFYNKPLTPPPDFGGKYVGTSSHHPLFTHKLLYGFDKVKKDLIKNQYTIRIVEGQKAAIASGGVALFGCSIHAEQIQLLEEYGVKKAIIAFDGDAAGRAASIRLLDELHLLRGIVVLLVKLPPETQPDVIAKMFGKSALDGFFSAAILPIQWFIDTKRDIHGQINIQDKFSIVQELQTHLISLPPIQLDLTIQYLSEALSIDPVSIKAHIDLLKLNNTGLVNKDAELTVIRKAILDPKYWSSVRQAIPDQKVFSIAAYQHIFNALDICHKRARDLSGPESVTMRALLDELALTVPHVKDLPLIVDSTVLTEPKYEFVDALTRVVDLFRRRVAAEQSKTMALQIQDLNKTTNDLISQFRRGLVSSLSIKCEDLSRPDTLAESMGIELAHRMTLSSDIIGFDPSNIITVDGEVIPCLPGLTRVLSGIQKQKQIVISANSGVGKSMLAMQIAVSLAVCPAPVDQVPVLFIPLEMNEKELAFRILAILSGVSAKKILSARFSNEEFKRVDKAREMLALSHLYIKVPEHGTIDEILSIIDEYKFRYGIEGVVLDYLQLIGPSEADKGTRRDEMFGRASKLLKRQVALNMNMFSISVAQLNRKDFKKGEIRGQENVGGSYEISQDADIHMLLSEKTEEQIEEDRNQKGNRICNIDKQRGGESDVIINYELDDGKGISARSRGCTLRCTEVIDVGQMLGLTK